jgi:phosphoglycolate phosphatase
MKFKAVIFDLDGTLLDTVDDLTDAANSVLRRFGYPEHDRQTIQSFIGDGLRALMERALPESLRDEDTIQRCFELLKSAYAGCWTNKTYPYPGIPDLLEDLLNANIAISILSNKADDATQQIVAKLLSRWPFRTVLGAKAGIPPKPDPTAALIIAEKLEASPREIIFLGDTSIDMQTAAASGMYGIGALWGFRPADEMIAGGARILLRNPRDLIPWI